MTNKTRFYLVRTSKGTSEYSGEQKLKYNPYNYGYAVALEDEQPTFYETEESATSIATTLNSLYKEEVKVIKVTNNSPSEVS